MPFLNKLPGFVRTPHGLEWKILRNTPWFFLASLLIIGIFTLVAHMMPPELPANELAKHLDMVNILAIAILITVWTGIFTVAIGAFVVYLMKGPAYAWDPMEVSDSDEP